jgi:hypothetical protein
MRNFLLVARRRDRISAQGLAERVAALTALPLSIDAGPALAVASISPRATACSSTTGSILKRRAASGPRS